jgi:DNA mismatch repair protein MutS2
MKFFIENANGKTLFFIDELGGGSDPNLGGAFAEVILEEMVNRHSFGIVTTHYLNLKVMAAHTPGIINGAMVFDEINLRPLYKLSIGKPGSSYTFSIAERIGFPKSLISKARKLVDEDHFRLDKLLNSTEQDLEKLEEDKAKLKKLLSENEHLKAAMLKTLDKVKHQERIELLKHQNKITEERILYLKEMERKLKQIISEWRKSDDKEELVRQIQNLLFRKKEQLTNKHAKKVDSKYIEVNKEISVGSRVKMKKNYQVGEVREIRGKRAVVQIGLLPMNVALSDLVVVEAKEIATL